MRRERERERRREKKSIDIKTDEREIFYPQLNKRKTVKKTVLSFVFCFFFDLRVT